MTYDDPTGTAGAPSSTTYGAAGAAHVARTEAHDVATSAAEKARGLLDEGRDQLGTVAGEAGRQARSLLGELGSEVSSQAQHQQTRLAGGLRSFGNELTTMADGAVGAGLAADVARQLGHRTTAAAQWLDQRDPATVLEDVKDFARRRPGTFLAIAAGVGLLAGRLTRGIKDAPPAPTQGSVPRRSSAYPMGGSRPVSATSGSDATGAGSAAYGSVAARSRSDELAAPLSAPLDVPEPPAVTEPLGGLVEPVPPAGLVPPVEPEREPRREDWR